MAAAVGTLISTLMKPDHICQCGSLSAQIASAGAHGAVFRASGMRYQLGSFRPD
jgi:hypothetical protein